MHIYKFEKKKKQMLTHLKFIFVKYALKVELCSLNVTSPQPPTEAVSFKIFQTSVKKKKIFFVFFFLEMVFNDKPDDFRVHE